MLRSSYMKTIGYIGLALLLTLLITACGGGGSSTPAVITGDFQVTVVDATTANDDEPSLIENARVIVFDGETGEPIATVNTDAAGVALFEELEPGLITVRIAALGFESSPKAFDITPIPFEVTVGELYATTIGLSPLDPATDGTLGIVSGLVVDDGEIPLSGALVVCVVKGEEHYTTTDSNGEFVFFNLPGGTFPIPELADIKIYKGGFEFDTVIEIEVFAGLEADAGNIVSTGAAIGVINGSVNAVATGGTPLPASGFDVTLLIPGSSVTIQGLKAFADATSNGYTITGVPDGTYEILASRDNDLFVTDPHDIVRDGIALVTLSEGEVTSDLAVLDFKVTLAVDIVCEEEFVVGTLPWFTFDDAPSFPSAKWFVIEVLDGAGDYVIKGFSDEISATSDERIINHKIHKDDIRLTATSYQWTFDTSIADAELVEGGRYQFRLYAIKVGGDKQEAQFEEYNFESASEDLKGVFTIVAPPADSER